MKRISLSVLTLILLSLLACTPKVPKITTAPVEEKPAVVPVGPCSDWFETGNEEEASNEHVIYRDMLKADKLEDAFPHWEKAFSLAPMADGKRFTHFEDGIRLYDYFFRKASDPTLKKEQVQKVMDLYDRMGACGRDTLDIAGRKAFDYYYSYRDYTSDDTIYHLFKASVDKFDLATPYYVLNPFTAILMDQYAVGKVTLAEAQHYTAKIKAILAKGLADCKNPTACETWRIIESYAPVRLADFEGVEGFYDCTYFVDKYYKEFEADPTNCEVIKEVLGRLRFGGCAMDMKQVTELRQALATNCQEAPVEAGPLRKGYEALQDGKPREALNYFLEYTQSSSDPEKKSRFLYVIAQIYYGSLRNFPQARKYALEAAEVKPNWGDPYIMIGKLYASSGPLCGPGRGFDSQRVVWAAIDKFEQAKRVDPSVTAEANRLINQYTQYMPAKGDLHMMGLAEGAAYTVPCWINERTRIRGIADN